MTAGHQQLQSPVIIPDRSSRFIIRLCQRLGSCPPADKQVTNLIIDRLQHSMETWLQHGVSNISHFLHHAASKPTSIPPTRPQNHVIPRRNGAFAVCWPSKTICICEFRHQALNETGSTGWWKWLTKKPTKPCGSLTQMAYAVRLRTGMVLCNYCLQYIKI